MNQPSTVEIPPREPAPALLPGKVVLVGGVGPDLGRSLALRAAQAGADVVLAARDGERLASIEAEVHALDRRAVSVVTDVSDPDARRRLAEEAMAAFGRVDVLMYAAFAHPPSMSLLEVDLDEMRRMSEVNVLAAVGLVQELAGTLVAGQGSVVLVNSVVLRNRLPGFGSYRMDKSALLGAARSLSIELAPRGVRVNTVAPGYIWGDKLRGSLERGEARGGPTVAAAYERIARDTDSRRLPTPDEIADTAVFLASDFASGITGQCVDVTCGQSHH